MSPVVDLLVRACARLASPHRHCRLVQACSEDWVPVDPRDLSAVRWCMYGALYAESNDFALVAEAALYLQRHVPDGHIAKFSDSASHGEILAAYDAAIVEARETPRGTR